MIYIIYFFIHLHTHTYILHMQIYAWKTYTFYKCLSQRLAFLGNMSFSDAQIGA